MSFEIKNYEPNLLKMQVDLLWEVTDDWKYPYATAYSSVEQVYAREDFDPSTRFYAVKDNQLIGFVTSRIVKDEEKGDYTLILDCGKKDCYKNIGVRPAKPFLSQS